MMRLQQLDNSKYGVTTGEFYIADVKDNKDWRVFPICCDLSFTVRMLLLSL